MLKLAFFFALLPFAFLEVFLYKQFGLVVLGSLYFALSMQAEYAANRFMLQGLRWPVPTRQAEEKPRETTRKEPVREPVREAPRPAAQAAPRQAPPPPAKEKPRMPNYSGRAHEVLAVPENAATRTIKFAFRFWLKKVHPDHNHTQPSELLNRRVQKITEAKDLLLDRRRATKKTAAA